MKLMSEEDVFTKSESHVVLLSIAVSVVIKYLKLYNFLIMWLLALVSLPLHLQNGNIVLRKIRAKLFNCFRFLSVTEETMTKFY